MHGKKKRASAFMKLIEAIIVKDHRKQHKGYFHNQSVKAQWSKHK